MSPEVGTRSPHEETVHMRPSGREHQDAGGDTEHVLTDGDLELLNKDENGDAEAVDEFKDEYTAVTPSPFKVKDTRGTIEDIVAASPQMNPNRNISHRDVSRPIGQFAKGTSPRKRELPLKPPSDNDAVATRDFSALTRELQTGEVATRTSVKLKSGDYVEDVDDVDLEPDDITREQLLADVHGERKFINHLTPVEVVEIMNREPVMELGINDLEEITVKDFEGKAGEKLRAKLTGEEVYQIMAREAEELKGAEPILDHQLQQVTVADLNNPNIIRQLGKEGVWQVVNQKPAKMGLGAKIASFGRKLFGISK